MNFDPRALFVEDMKKCSDCKIQDCQFRKLADYLNHTGGKFFFYQLDSNSIPDEIKNDYYHYLDIINPDLFD